MKASAPTTRKARAVESFGLAAEAIGDITRGMALFAITRGQWSMIDAILHCLDRVGPSRVTLWTWTVAEYEIQVLTRLRIDKRLTGGLLVIDYGARYKNAPLIAEWKQSFGRDSVRYCMNHSKIATVASESGFRLLLRGSMNLNFNPRFEQFDISEGDAAVELVTRIENDLPVLPDDAGGDEVYKATKLDSAFTPEQLQIFGNVKPWKPNRNRNSK